MNVKEFFTGNPELDSIIGRRLSRFNLGSLVGRLREMPIEGLWVEPSVEVSYCSQSVLAISDF